jgi:hypothetical protein
MLLLVVLIVLVAVRVVHVVKLHKFSFFVPCCEVRFNVRLFLAPICFVRCLCFVCINCIYLRILVSNVTSKSYDVRVV